jgi:AcrR family transcriptional regulator
VPTDNSARQPRADARENRVRLLAAALELLTESPAEASLSAVAARAGVGIGTLYRHFPTRDALVEAVFRNEVARLSDGAVKLLRDTPPEVALETWLERYAALVATKEGLSGALQAMLAPGSDLYVASSARVMGAITMLLEAAAASGAIRTDVDPKDILVTVAASIAPGAKDWKPRTYRVVRLLIDGLRYRAGRSA